MTQFHFLSYSIDGLGGLKSEDISVFVFLNRLEMVILHIHVSETEPTSKIKSGNFGQRVNSDIHLQTVKIQMRRLLMSRLIRIFTFCIVNLIFIPIIQK